MMPKVTPNQEDQICDALTKLGWLETEQALHSEGVRAVRDVLQCSTEDAKTVLGDVRARKLVDLEITPGGQLDARKPMPLAQWRWIRTGV
jgi:hypothetical protein